MLYLRAWLCRVYELYSAHSSLETLLALENWADVEAKRKNLVKPCKNVAITRAF